VGNRGGTDAAGRAREAASGLGRQKERTQDDGAREAIGVTAICFFFFRDDHGG